MQNIEQNDEETGYIWPKERREVLDRLQVLEAEYAVAPSVGARALMIALRHKLRWYERKHGRASNVGTVSLCTSPGRRRRPDPARNQAQFLPPVGLGDLLPGE